MTQEVSQADNRAVGAVAATTSVAALACGVCCVLPLAIPAAMLGTFGGTLAWFADAHGWMTPLAIVAVVAGWIWVAVQSRRSRRRPARSTIAIMVFATVMMVLAYLWPVFEGPVSAMLRR